MNKNIILSPNVDAPVVENMKILTNENLISCFGQLVHNERKITAQVLEYVCEIDQRRLYLNNGYTSLYDFLVKEYGYSPGAAMRRIDGARLLKELPEVSEKFKNGALTLSQAVQVQKAAREFKKINNSSITAQEKRHLVSQIENVNQKESEKTIALVLDLPVVPMQKETVHKNNSVTLTITLSAEQMALLEQAQNMIAHSVPNKSWAETFTYLAQKEVSRRTVKTPSKKATSVIDMNPVAPIVCETTSVPLESRSTTTNPRATHFTAVAAVKRRPHIPLKIRKQLLHPLALCEYKNSDGSSCSNKRFLQIDHIRSLSNGGSHTRDNFQVLCGVHNRLKYKLE